MDCFVASQLAMDVNPDRTTIPATTTISVRPSSVKPFPDRYRHDEAEHTWRSRWAGTNAFKWDPGTPAESDYVIDTPPPTVSGTLHIGHVYSYTQADIIARYFRMSGRNVLYPIGWDDNGLPTERLVEKVKKVRGGTMQRDAFIALCREVIPEYENQFRDLFSRLALSVDWTREYQTISEESRTISQLSFLDLYKKGLAERRLEPTLWDPADRTAIAQAEVDEIEREGVLNHIPFRIDGDGEAVIATTRPELLAACSALMIHPDDPRAVELICKRAISPLFGVPVPIIADDKVDPEKGTGIVMCCTFGDVTDIQWWRSHKLPLRVVIDQAGRMKADLPIGTPEWPSVDAAAADAALRALKGLKTDKAREVVLGILADRGQIYERKAAKQIIPVAERSGAPLEIIVTPQWFIKTLEFKNEILAAGREIIWRPDYMRQRFESWVEGLKWDWSISRQRHFGVPLPVWYSKRPGEEGKIIVPSLQQLPVDPTVDLPEGFSADEVDGEADVMDTWATSSVSPQLITRTINDEFGFDHAAHKRLFPMALRPQAHEIIRTWAFYTIVKALHHERKIPWRDIAVSGWCLASDGEKMSKSKGNVIDPIKLLDEYGSDVVRYWTGTSRLGNDTVLSPNTLQQGKRLVTKIWNAAKLAHLSLKRADIQPVSPKADIEAGIICHALDRWLLGHLSETVSKATEAFETYEYAQALRGIEDFFWRTHCDNYLEIVKTRIGVERESSHHPEMVKTRVGVEGQPTPVQLSALHTLYHATGTIIRLFAPFLPFVTDTINDLFQNESYLGHRTVHSRGEWPKASEQADATLNREKGDAFVEVVAAARKVKSDLALSLRAPVLTLAIGSAKGLLGSEQIQDLIGDTAEDLRSITNARTLVWDKAGMANHPNALSPNERFQVSLQIARPEGARG
jgi:valyl-tRNA synthetase